MIRDMLLEAKKFLVSIASILGIPHVGLGSADPDVRGFAVRSMVGERFVRRLIRVLTQDPDSYVRVWSARILGEIGDPRAVPCLVKTSFSDPNPDVREAAIDALRDIGVNTPDVVAAIQRALNDSDEWVGRAARRALRSLK